MTTNENGAYMNSIRNDWGMPFTPSKEMIEVTLEMIFQEKLMVKASDFIRSELDKINPDIIMTLLRENDYLDEDDEIPFEKIEYFANQGNFSNFALTDLPAFSPVSKITVAIFAVLSEKACDYVKATATIKETRDRLYDKIYH